MSKDIPIIVYNASSANICVYEDRIEATIQRDASEEFLKDFISIITSHISTKEDTSCQKN